MDSSTSSESEDEYTPPRKRRTFKPRINFDQITDPFQIKEKFRICPKSMEYVLEHIGEDIAHGTSRNYALTPEQQLMVALRWLGNGGQYHGVADMHGVHKSTVHRCLARVTRAIMSNLFSSEVRWPDQPNTFIALEFMEYAGFPRVAGCIDGSLIPIDAPKNHEAAFVDRHGDHSINTMVVCGPNMEFFYASARWPGSVHDSRVLRNSSLYERWQAGWRPFPGAVLLGDSGYALLEWLLTPVERPGPRVGVERFLRRHKSTRRLVECAIGILKEKFPCLNNLRVAPEFAGNIILACITLHNIQKKISDEEIDPENHHLNGEDEEDPSIETPTARAGAVYDEFVRLFAAET